MDITLARVPDEAVKQLVRNIDRDGFGCLPGYIPGPNLGAMQSFVSAALNRARGQYVGFTGQDAMAGSSLDALAASSEFRNLMRRIYEIGTGRAAPEVQFYQVLRCLTGHDAQRHSLRFHYDSYVVTALVPVEIPSSGVSGDFIMLPNTRRIRASYAANLIDKLMLDNRLTQSALRLLARLKLLPLVRVKPVPGHVYFFWGYRSIHTNEACDPDKVRATALFHYANPHDGDWLKSKLRRSSG